MTLKDFWNSYSGVVDFINKDGEAIDDMDYPLETEVIAIRHSDPEYYEVQLNV